MDFVRPGRNQKGKFAFEFWKWLLLARRTCAYDVRRKEGSGIELSISLPSFVIRFPLAFERQPKLLFVTISKQQEPISEATKKAMCSTPK